MTVCNRIKKKDAVYGHIYCLDLNKLKFSNTINCVGRKSILAEWSLYTNSERSSFFNKIKSPDFKDFILLENDLSDTHQSFDSWYLFSTFWDNKKTSGKYPFEKLNPAYCEIDENPFSLHFWSKLLLYPKMVFFSFTSIK